MIQLRKCNDRGHANHGWLDSHHTFSFADYYDPDQMGYSALRVINEDRVVPGQGFPTHGHRDMEIVSYVLSGALEHKDSMGNGSVIRPGDVQRMSAGTGIRHSEFNGSSTEPVHFLQIWIQPNVTGIAPGYEQKNYSNEELDGRFRVVASPDGRSNSLHLHQDALIYAARMNRADPVEFPVRAGRRFYVHVARGSISLNQLEMQPGDGARVEGESRLIFSQANGAEVLLFDLP